MSTEATTIGGIPPCPAMLKPRNTVREAAGWLRKHPKTVEGYMREGLLEYHKSRSGSVTISDKAVLEFEGAPRQRKPRKDAPVTPVLAAAVSRRPGHPRTVGGMAAAWKRASA